MNRTQKGSISVEAIVMLGIIASLTPILYKHVADRREDMDNITEANTLLLLKNAAAEYIEVNTDTLSVGTVLLEPTDIGIDISGYQIGIKKEANGTINAMIASTSGNNDMKAAKVASLLGVSAGIYSAQDSSKAWGINGIWAENISSYGFTSLPTGVPVVTTTYDKEESFGINEEELKNILESTSYDSLTAKKLCIDNPEIPEDERCIEDWNIIGINPLEIIAGCNSGIQSACEKGWLKNINRSCLEISIKYKGAGFMAPSDIYKLTTSRNTQVERACYFVNGELPTNEQLIEAVKTDAIARRYDWENHKISASCQNIITNWTEATTDFYTLVTGISTYQTNQPCVFTGSRVATNGEVITQCNSAIGSGAACRYGWINNLNRSCERVIASNTSAPSGYYNITTSSGASSQPCFFVNHRVATGQETIVACNASTTSAAMNSNISCRFGYVREYNNNCANILGNYPAGIEQTHSITTSNGGTRKLCLMSCEVIGSVTDGECKDVNGWGWVRTSTALNYWDSIDFCNALNMALKTPAQLQSDGLWNPGYSNPFANYWVWTTNTCTCGQWSSTFSNDCGCQAYLGTGVLGWNHRESVYDGDWTVSYGWVYALCGPK